MIKPFKIRQTENCKLFVTSDPHFCHDRPFVIQKRGFFSPQEHDEALIKNWNETVRPTDQTIIIGDFMLNGSLDKCKDYFRRLNGEIFYLNGNHESYTSRLYHEIFGGYDNYIEKYPVSWENVTFWGNYKELIIDGQYTICHHFPYLGWHKMKEGSFCLSAHEHMQMPETHPDTGIERQMDVGIDYKLRPWAFDEIRAILSKREVVNKGHH